MKIVNTSCIILIGKIVSVFFNQIKLNLGILERKKKVYTILTRRIT